MKNVHGKSHPQQRKISSKKTKGKQKLKQLPANPKLSTTMTQVNPKFVIGRWRCLGFVSKVCAVSEVLCLVSDRHYTESGNCSVSDEE
jgi:hypothetical protein